LDWEDLTLGAEGLLHLTDTVDLATTSVAILAEMEFNDR
jgi:hypothetical protein